MEDSYEESNTRQPKGSKSRGLQSSIKRKELRATTRAKDEALAITNAALKDLGLDETPIQGLKPSMAAHPSGVQINLLSSNMTVKEQMIYTKSVAPRSLAILLDNEDMIKSYRKICAVALTARVSQAQLAAPHVTGNTLELKHRLISDSYQDLSNRLKKIPSCTAWLLGNIGLFNWYDVIHVPLLPLADEKKPDLLSALSGNYFNVAAYVHQHRGIGGANIPPEERDLANILCSAFPLDLTPHRLRFTVASAALFQQTISHEEWQAFERINHALSELKCTEEYNFLKLEGQPLPIVRFPDHHTDLAAYCTYYANHAVNTRLMRAAMIMQLGKDAFLTPEQRHDRFIGPRNVAWISGGGPPGAFLNALFYLMKRN